MISQPPCSATCLRHLQETALLLSYIHAYSTLGSICRECIIALSTRQNAIYIFWLIQGRKKYEKTSRSRETALYWPHQSLHTLLCKASSASCCFSYSSLHSSLLPAVSFSMLSGIVSILNVAYLSTEDPSRSNPIPSRSASASMIH